jgi:ABC-type antimicrobial peptide transport system permease subunit
MALGARRAHILNRVLLMGGRLVAAGAGVGLLAAYTFSDALVNSPVISRPLDVVTFAAVAGLVVCVGLVACFLPAWRAATVDPVAALRGE